MRFSLANHNLIDPMRLLARKSIVYRLSLLSGLALLAGCGFKAQTDASRFFVLAPQPIVAEPEGAQGEKDGPAVGVGRVYLPAYTDRPQIVTRLASSELHLSEFNRWAEPLTVSFGRALGQNLAQRLQSEKITLFPWPRAFERDYEVHVTALEFDGSFATAQTSLVARWQITTARRAEVLYEAESVFKEKVQGGAGDYAALVDAWSMSIAALSQQIADQIEILQQDSGRSTP